METKFGELKYHREAKRSKTIIRRILSILLLFILFFLIGILILMIVTDKNTSSEVYAYSFIGFFVFSLFASLFFGTKLSPQDYEIYIYERGVTLNRKKEMLEYDFRNLDGVASYVIRDKLEGIITIAKTQYLTIFPQHEKPKYLRSMNTPNIKETSQNLAAIYCEYVTKDLNKETIKNRTITFGRNLTIKNGSFVYKNNTKVVPYESFYEAKNDDGVIILKSENDSFILSVANSMNLNILYYIIYRINED